MELLPFDSRYSPSSGGSDNGLDVAESGLEGGLPSSTLSTEAFRREGRDGVAEPLIEEILVSRVIGDKEGEFLTCSEKCS
jgi:hypothetical protein